MIYEPAEDSFLLRKVLEKEEKKANSVLEIGIGSGYLSEYLDSITKDFVGVDINLQAIQETKKKVKGKILKSDLYTSVPKKEFEIIVFNPPYLPKSAADGEEALATVGGTHGYEVILRFINELSDYLHPQGRCYLLFSSLSKPKIILDAIEKNGCHAEKIAQTSIMMEELFVYRITLSHTMQLLKNNISRITFVAKGKRSIVYKGIYKKKPVAIKVLRTDTDAKHTIENEAHNLQLVNTFGIGPKYLFQEDNFVVMEFVQGIPFDKYWHDATKAQIKRCLFDLLDQCHIMDKNYFQKLEMTRPYKNVLVHTHCTLIDFERGRITKDPINTTQFLHFLHSSKFAAMLKERFNASFSQETLIYLAKEYKNNKNISEIKKYITLILK